MRGIRNAVAGLALFFALARLVFPRNPYVAGWIGMIGAVLMLELMSKKGQGLHHLVEPLRHKYFISGEINTKLPSMAAVPAKLEAIALHYATGHQYTLDGISVEYPDWHFNVRPSNTEPLL